MVSIGKNSKAYKSHWEGELNDGEVDLLVAVAGGGDWAEAKLGQSVPVEDFNEDSADDGDSDGDEMFEIGFEPSIYMRGYLLFLMDLWRERTALTKKQIR